MAQEGTEGGAIGNIRDEIPTQRDPEYSRTFHANIMDTITNVRDGIPAARESSPSGTGNAAAAIGSPPPTTLDSKGQLLTYDPAKPPVRDNSAYGSARCRDEIRTHRDQV